MSSKVAICINTVLRRGYPLLPLVAFLIAGTGCGGGNSNDSAGSESTTKAIVDKRPTKAEYLAQGDALCADLQVDGAELRRDAQRLQAQSTRLEKKEFLARAAAFWSDQVAFIKRFHRKFEALSAPPGDEARVREFMRSIEDGLEIAEEIQQTLDNGREVPSATVEDYGRVVARGNTLAQAYGFKVCGRTR
jgi:hypothetical protein